MRKDILLCSNDNGFVPMMVLINSILMNNEDVVFHIMQASITEEHKEFIRSWIEEKNGLVTIYEADKEFVDKMQRLRSLLPASHVTVEGFFRLYAVNKIEAVDRVLYLDIDTVVDGDLSELFTMDFEGNYFCAARDSGKDWTALKGKLGIPFEYPYINSGVLLMNIAELKKVINDDFIIDFLVKHHERFSFCDQDMINKAWYRNIKIISNKYNSLSREVKGMKPARYEGDALIYHYTGPVKFWNQYDENSYFWGMDVYAKYTDNAFADNLCEKVKSNIERFKNNAYIVVENNGKKLPSAANWGNCLIFYYRNVKGKNSTCVEYLRGMNIKNVAIYGVGEIGKFVCDEIIESNSECRVKYFIDRASKAKEYNGVEVIRPFTMAKRIKEIDAIIIAVIKDSFEDIEEYLHMLNINANIISVYQLLFYVNDSIRNE